ncbi:hypothetical protein Nepgr_020366 [Nepenthes gracilis]|uniref:Uncharacterized protein n=1 Tax=Nepenthes gracilis TaxID=150966 RepID=A0AAD3XW77_NEPGR|nr:hypothetical protein Nepgr_020366 [Nepenthes gracilis]
MSVSLPRADNIISAKRASTTFHLPSAATDPVVQPHQQAPCTRFNNRVAPTLNYTTIKSAALSKSQADTQLLGSDNLAAGDKMKAAPGISIQPQAQPDRKNCHIPTAMTKAWTFKSPRPYNSTESSAPTSMEMPSHSISIQAQSQLSIDRKSEEHH